MSDATQHTHTLSCSRSRQRPIFIIGCGSIVRDAHLPGYALLAAPILGFFDLDHARAQTMAHTVRGSVAFSSLHALIAACTAADGIFDVALPPAAQEAALLELPLNSRVLLQKPFGETLEHATRLLTLARQRTLVGAVNFQLRHSPCIGAVRGLLAQEAIGEVIDIECRVVCHMPWETWSFTRLMPRMEVVMHSIHYLDLVRGLFGEPERVWCSTTQHPLSSDLTDTRSATIMSFGPTRRAVVTTFHHHRAPHAHDCSQLKIEGTRGTIVAQLGVNLDYPRGRPDHVQWSRDEQPWTSVPLEGNWFPHAFAGSMNALQRFVAGESTTLESEFADAWRTMALVETCYQSAARGETPPNPPENSGFSAMPLPL